jgi:hypothetical protein
VIAHNLSRWTVAVGGIDSQPATDPPAEDNPRPTGRSGDDKPARPSRKSFVTTDTLRRCYLAIPGRLARSARQRTLHLPARWPWAEPFNRMLDAIRTIQLAT